MICAPALLVLRSWESHGGSWMTATELVPPLVT